jgi:hypothetical protein
VKRTENNSPSKKALEGIISDSQYREIRTLIEQISKAKLFGKELDKKLEGRMSGLNLHRPADSEDGESKIDGINTESQYWKLIGQLLKKLSPEEESKFDGIITDSQYREMRTLIEQISKAKLFGKEPVSYDEESIPIKGCCLKEKDLHETVVALLSQLLEQQKKAPQIVHNHYY